MYAIIDVETTGGNAFNEKLTEIAIYQFDGKQVTGEYSTLINPERSIPFMISRLTGITDEMVRDAPKFYEVAKDIIQMTEGRIFVAHNANFDYNFIRLEYKRLGYSYNRKTLCTVKLSRKLIPGHRSYSLGNLCNDLGINIRNRHRAAGDAEATVKVLEKLLSVDPSLCGMPSGAVNPSLNRAIFATLPESPGVYYFHDEDGKVIYVGKSRNIHARVLSHFSNQSATKAIAMKEKIVDITFEQTGSELLALLLESDEIKKLKPLFNRAQRRSNFSFGLFCHTDIFGYQNLGIAEVNSRPDPVTTFSTHAEAKEFLFSLAETFNLCQKLCGLYDAQGACFQRGIKACAGACTGEEPPQEYNYRVNNALKQFDFGSRNFIVVDKGRHDDERSVVMVENGKYAGFGYIPVDEAVQHTDTIREYLNAYPDNREIRQIIRGYIRRNKVERIIRF
jgi:DNA polymerase III subunit epsilon